MTFFTTKFFIWKVYKEEYIVCLEPNFQVTEKGKFPTYILRMNWEKGRFDIFRDALWIMGV